MRAPTPNPSHPGTPAPHPGGGAAPDQVARARAHRRQLSNALQPQVALSALSAQQCRVLGSDGPLYLTYLGTDAKGRPVVEALVGIPNALRTWAVLRNGDPTDVTQPVALVHREPEPEQCTGDCGGVFCSAVRTEPEPEPEQQRLAITVVVLVAAGTDPDAAGSQVFDLVAADPLDLAPLVLEAEGYDMEVRP